MLRDKNYKAFMRYILNFGNTPVSIPVYFWELRLWSFLLFIFIFVKV